ncbi:galactose-1-phosphate uridylyltransferase isoform X1 [Hydra vulgaris]|uniref:galactose-1-phosphate uridylyltransferase isoform X1 n=1 Tax=Hydra vulgaris TaxID=6087 RepID=UPI001F5FDF0D|nr:galactose-1-phosphate uridylyltransferase isoform X1 [Hydra vulgaris]XP_047139817.1 galactose-1-phosphate uridylyltransferase isoform X1 [Hydra vulgaris]
MFDAEEHTHQRLNPLLNEWVIVSPHRTKRPWNGQVETSEEASVLRHDITNPLCPGVMRPSGKVNENYTSTYVFENDFPALLTSIPEPQNSEDDLFQVKSATGICRVMCFHPYSDLSLPLMSENEILAVIAEWIRQVLELSQKYEWIQIFENKGTMMGCSNVHPHCQIWACSFLPRGIQIEDDNQRMYYKKHKKSMLMEYARKEMEKKDRIVVENQDWLVVVPYWAMWPYELLVLPKAPTKRISDLTQIQQKSLAIIMKIFLTKYDNLFKTSFPYTMGWHGAPFNEKCLSDCSHWQLHAHYFPPLLRSASIKKHMVGFEMLAGPMRDITPEKAASILRGLSSVHYKEA